MDNRPEMYTNQTDSALAYQFLRGNLHQMVIAVVCASLLQKAFEKVNRPSTTKSRSRIPRIPPAGLSFECLEVDQPMPVTQSLLTKGLSIQIPPSPKVIDNGGNLLSILVSSNHKTLPTPSPTEDSIGSDDVIYVCTIKKRVESKKHTSHVSKKRKQVITKPVGTEMSSGEMETSSSESSTPLPFEWRRPSAIAAATQIRSMEGEDGGEEEKKRKKRKRVPKAHSDPSLHKQKKMKVPQKVAKTQSHEEESTGEKRRNAEIEKDIDDEEYIDIVG